jgi:hypothetical protein
MGTNKWLGTNNWLCRSASLFLILTLALASSASAFQEEESKKKKVTPQGTPVLWREPADIATRDLFLGPGGEAMKPDLSKVTFVKEETGGYSPKFRVKDGAGKTWVAKLGKEAQPETAAVRLIWAAGYVTEVSYLVPCAKIEGAPRPKKDVARCEGGGFTNVRFEARPDEWERLDEWGWKQNPFNGTKELQGLVVLMAMLNNWDLKDSNNKVIYVPGEAGQPGELRYVISDLGATLGKTGNFFTRSRNKPEDFVKAKFIKGVEGGRVDFNYTGKSATLFDGITVEQASWLGGLLSQLSDQQISDAFRAANYSPEDVAALTRAFRVRINELTSISTPVGERTASP